VTPAAHREAAAYLRSTYQMSERRGCRVIGADRASVRYQATRPDDGDLRERLKALAQERRRFGYRRLHVLLRREGQVVNKKRVQRLYREERLTVRRRGGRKRAMGTRRPIETPLAANQRWSLDFVSDQMTDGRRFRILTVIDNCTRECLALVADTSLSGRRVARELDAIVYATWDRARCFRFRRELCGLFVAIMKRKLERPDEAAGEVEYDQEEAVDGCRGGDGQSLHDGVRRSGSDRV